MSDEKKELQEDKEIFEELASIEVIPDDPKNEKTAKVVQLLITYELFWKPFFMRHRN